MAKRGLKRSLLDDLDSVDKPTQHAKVHGVILELSPMKPNRSRSCTYFDGQISDGKKKTRLVGFDEDKHKILAEYHAKREPIALEDCEVKKANISQDMEIMVKKPILFNLQRRLS